MQRKLWLAFFAFASLVCAQQECRSPLGVPCYTIRGTHTQWHAFKNGLTDIRQFKTQSVNALRRDGSYATVHEESSGKLFGGASTSNKSVGLYLAPENAIVTINHTRRTIARREPLIWHDRPYRRSADYDLTCETGIKHAGTDFNMLGTTKIAGVTVVRWHRAIENGSEDLYLAPSLDCVALKTYRIQRNSLWVPTFIDSWEAASVELGEPQPHLFTLPSAFREVEDSHRARLLDRKAAHEQD